MCTGSEAGIAMHCDATLDATSLFVFVKGEDTRNDTAIARVLQFEENEQAGLPHPSTHVPGTRGGSGSHTSSEDYRLARQMQQEYDAEMAFLVQQEEERESRGKTVGLSWVGWY